MDESAQQAISVGVNVTIFIVALTISLTLMLAVRNLAETASEVDTSMPDGAILLSTQNVEDRIISGYELISYYYNYIVPYYHNDQTNENEYNYPNVGVIIKKANGAVYKKEIKDGNNQNIENEKADIKLDEFRDQLDLDANYVLNVKSHYDNTGTISGTTVICIEQIPELVKGEIFEYYTRIILRNFVDENTHKLFSKSTLRIVYEDKSYYINVNEDNKKNYREVRDFINKLEDGQKYSVRIKRNALSVNMKSSSIIMYIDKAV